MPLLAIAVARVVVRPQVGTYRVHVMRQAVFSPESAPQSKISQYSTMCAFPVPGIFLAVLSFEEIEIPYFQHLLRQSKDGTSGDFLFFISSRHIVASFEAHAETDV